MNILLELSKAFSYYCISSQDAPSYVRIHCMEKNKPIILMYKKSQSVPEVTPKKKDSHQSTMVSEFELTGSPLRIDMTYERLEETFLNDLSMCWQKEEGIHEGVSVKEAVQIVNWYNKRVRGATEGGDGGSERAPLWVVCDGRDSQNTLLMVSDSYQRHFNRGVVTNMNTIAVKDLSVDKLKEIHMKTYGCNKTDALDCKVLGTFRLSGKRVSNDGVGQGNDEVFSKHYIGMTQLECEWSQQTLSVPIHDVTINLVQESIIGHKLSNCGVLLKSLYALQGISSGIISFASTVMPVKLEDISIRPFSSVSCPQPTLQMLESSIQNLLREVQEYSGLAWEPSAGCVCITEDYTSLRQVLGEMNSNGSSNDFTFKLWDILRDCDTVEDLVTLLVYALKEIYKRNLRPFIDPSNTTVLGVLVKKLSRGASAQAVTSLGSLLTSPTRALGLLGQLGLHKTCWEYTNLFTLIDTTLGFNDRLKLQNKVSEVYEEVYNQTIMDMSLGTGEMTLNPFDSRCNLMDSTFMQDTAEAVVSHTLADLTLEEFASLKRHNIQVKSDKKVPEKDQPLFSDDMNTDISTKEWKFKLTRLSQLHTCLEHIYRIQLALNCDYNSLKPLLVNLLEHYTSEQSPVRTIGQLRYEPVQCFTHSVPYKQVKDHLHFKHATMYKICFTSTRQPSEKDYQPKDPSQEIGAPKQVIQSVFVCSQQPVFPPSICPIKEIPDETDTLFYHCTRYLYLSNTY